MTRFLLAIALAPLLASSVCAQADDARPLDIGSRRELFVDRFLIDSMSGTQLRLHAPREAEVAIRHDKPWEGRYSGYTTVIKDGSTYRMYYRGLSEAGRDGSEAETTCYAESADGVTWTKPDLGLFEVHGTRANNLILPGAAPFSHNFAPLLDERPGVPADERFKALGGIDGSGLVAFASADGIRWRKLRDEPVITKAVAASLKFNWLFDSQNVAFWSDAEQCYVCYFRVYDGLRKVARTTSKDFLTWAPAALMEQVVDDGTGPRPAPVEHIYTSQTTPYFRAPHLYVALPSRFMDGKDAITQEQKKQLGVPETYMPPGAGFNDVPLMTTRAGSTRYDRAFLEAWIRPGPDPKAWTSRANYPARGIVPTPPENPTELSVYVDRHVGYPTAHAARFTLRLDGFASVNAPFAGGEMVTRPLIFSGSKLALNFATSAVGHIRVEIQDAAGQPIPGFSLADSLDVIGDETDRVVLWKRTEGKPTPDVSPLAGRPVRLRFVMKDADLYAVQFPTASPGARP
jgi:hypothetical protein